MAGPRLRPRFTYLTNTIEGVPVDGYRPFVDVEIDGTRYFANGWNHPWYVDLGAGKLFPLGSTVPTTFAVSDSAGGSTFPAGRVVTYYLVFRNTIRQEETAPQIIAHTMSGTKDNDITWTDPGDGRWNKATIYRRKNLSNDIVRVADVAIATATYTDSTADGALSTLQADVYVPRYRTTLPPSFKAISAHLGRILGITGKDPNISYSQAVRPDGELVQTDFPSGNQVAVEPDDGLGENTAIFGHNDLTVIGKRRGLYLASGDFGDDSLTFRRMYAGRGLISARAWCAVHGAFIMLDEQGPYGWSPDAIPQVLGARDKGGAPASPLAPLWRRINRAAADLAHLTLREERGVVEFYIPLDHEPIARRAAVWNFRENRFDSIDDRIDLADGWLEDADERRHENYIDDLGFVWEREVIPSQGVERTPIRVTSLIGTPMSIQAGAYVYNSDPLVGPEGAPVQRRDATTDGSIGTLRDENRIFLNSTPTLKLLYWTDASLVLSQTLDLGTIPFVAEFARDDYRTADRKTAPRLIVRFTPQEEFLSGTPSMHVYTAPDAAAYTHRPARQDGSGIDMTNNDGWALVPCWDRFFKWNVKFEAHRACDALELQGVTADIWAGRLRR